MTKAPAYQRYPKDYMSDGNVLRMNFEERGIFDWLLDSCWLEDGIPADVAEIARICGLPVRKMAKAWTRISCCFVAHPRKPGWLTSPRLEKERASQAEHREARSEAGKKGAASRWLGHGQEDGNANGNAMREPMAKNSSAVCSLQLTTTSTSEARTRARPKRWRFCPPDWEPKPEHAALAAELHVDMAAQEAKFRDHEFDKPKSDPDRTFANWLRQAATYSNGTRNGNGKHQPKKRRVAKDGTILSA